MTGLVARQTAQGLSGRLGQPVVIESQAGAGGPIPEAGGAFISVSDQDKPGVVDVARRLVESGFTLYATRGTHQFLKDHGIESIPVFKVNEGRPNIADQIVNGNIHLIVNTPLGRESFFDDRAVRRAAMMHEVPCITTLTGAAAAVRYTAVPASSWVAANSVCRWYRPT